MRQDYRARTCTRSFRSEPPTELWACRRGAGCSRVQLVQAMVPGSRWQELQVGCAGGIFFFSRGLYS